MHTRNTGGGFTLIEVMITIVIVAILAAIAYPTYLGQVRKSRRADAKTMLLKAANRQERYYTTAHTYAGDMSALGFASDAPKTQNGAYSVEVNPGADSTRFQLEATALADQANDDCKTLGLNQLGEKTADGKPANDPVSQRCW